MGVTSMGMSSVSTWIFCFQFDVTFRTRLLLRLRLLLPYTTSMPLQILFQHWTTLSVRGLSLPHLEYGVSQRILTYGRRQATDPVNVYTCMAAVKPKWGVTNNTPPPLIVYNHKRGGVRLRTQP